MDEVGLRVLRVEGPPCTPPPDGPAHDDRHSDAGAVAAFAAKFVIWSKAHEMKSMNCISATGRRPIIAAPIAAPTIADSRDRRVDDALRAEPLEQAGGDPKRAAVDADVLAQDEDPLVALHLLPERVVDRLDVRVPARARHQRGSAGRSRNPFVRVAERGSLGVGRPLRVDVPERPSGLGIGRPAAAARSSSTCELATCCVERRKSSADGDAAPRGGCAKAVDRVALRSRTRALRDRRTPARRARRGPSCGR